jgi:hypothetical protein
LYIVDRISCVPRGQNDVADVFSRTGSNLLLSMELKNSNRWRLNVNCPSESATKTLGSISGASITD